MGVNEANLLGQHRHDLRELDVEPVLGHLDRLVNPTDGLLQERDGALLARNDLFPVPLVDVKRVNVVELLVGPQRVHVGINASARRDGHLGELQPLPFGQRMNHLGPALAHVADRERNGPLDAVQIVVDTRAGKHDHRGGHAQQRELSRQVLLEHVLDELDRLFGILDVVEQVAVARRLDKRHGAGVNR